MKKSFYSKFIIENMPRILTQVDRDEDSKTYGSCDRNYWHLKIRDFSSAILQQTCLTLAMVYKYDFDGNIYYKNACIKKWAIAALRYIGKIQLRDGSFNEYYPNEHGFPPTAFILYAGCMTYKELDLEDTEILGFLGKAASWLRKHVESRAYNQEWASIVGLYLYYTLTENEDVKQDIDKKLNNLLEKQSVEGWYMEQGGADIGYLSVTLDMMTEYYLYSKDAKVKESINGVVRFLQYFVHQDGTIGGEYGSRNTIYFMPNGIENVANMGLETSGIAKSIRNKVYNQGTGKNHFMDSVDERYLTHYVMHSYLRANCKYLDEKGDVILPCDSKHYMEFREAGLVTMNNGNYFVVIGASKGGIIKCYVNGKEKWVDCGYRSKIKEGTIATTNWLDSSYDISYLDKEIRIKGKFNVVTPKVQSPFYHFCLRVGAAILGNKVNSIVKKLTIFTDNHNEMEFERRIVLNEDTIIIHDKIVSPKLVDVYEADNNSLRLVASGKFYSSSDLLMTDLRRYNKITSLCLSKTYDVISDTWIVNKL